MSVEQMVQTIFQYGGTVIMAGLFVWLFFWIISKLNKMLEENTELLRTLAKSTDNVAKSLDLLNQNTITLDKKVDRNYIEIKENNK